jgi:hypothetical protein
MLEPQDDTSASQMATIAKMTMHDMCTEPPPPAKTRQQCGVWLFWLMCGLSKKVGLRCTGCDPVDPVDLPCQSYLRQAEKALSLSGFRASDGFEVKHPTPGQPSAPQQPSMAPQQSVPLRGILALATTEGSGGRPFLSLERPPGAPRLAFDAQGPPEGWFTAGGRDFLGFDLHDDARIMLSLSGMTTLARLRNSAPSGSIEALLEPLQENPNDGVWLGWLPSSTVGTREPAPPPWFPFLLYSGDVLASLSRAHTTCLQWLEQIRDPQIERSRGGTLQHAEQSADVWFCEHAVGRDMFTAAAVARSLESTRPFLPLRVRVLATHSGANNTNSSSSSSSSSSSERRTNTTAAEPVGLGSLQDIHVNPDTGAVRLSLLPAGPAVQPGDTIALEDASTASLTWTVQTVQPLQSGTLLAVTASPVKPAGRPFQDEAFGADAPNNTLTEGRSLKVGAEVFRLHVPTEVTQGERALCAFLSEWAKAQEHLPNLTAEPAVVVRSAHPVMIPRGPNGFALGAEIDLAFMLDTIISSRERFRDGVWVGRDVDLGCAHAAQRLMWRLAKERPSLGLEIVAAGQVRSAPRAHVLRGATCIQHSDVGAVVARSVGLPWSDTLASVLQREKMSGAEVRSILLRCLLLVDLLKQPLTLRHFFVTPTVGSAAAEPEEVMVASSVVSASSVASNNGKAPDSDDNNGSNLSSGISIHSTSTINDDADADDNSTTNSTNSSTTNGSTNGSTTNNSNSTIGHSFDVFEIEGEDGFPTLVKIETHGWKVCAMPVASNAAALSSEVAREASRALLHSVTLLEPFKQERIVQRGLPIVSDRPALGPPKMLTLFPDHVVVRVDDSGVHGKKIPDHLQLRCSAVGVTGRQTFQQNAHVVARGHSDGLLELVLDTQERVDMRTLSLGWPEQIQEETRPMLTKRDFGPRKAFGQERPNVRPPEWAVGTWRSEAMASRVVDASAESERWWDSLPADAHVAPLRNPGSAEVFAAEARTLLSDPRALQGEWAVLLDPVDILQDRALTQNDAAVTSLVYPSLAAIDEAWFERCRILPSQQ